jgi:hypothetical protein
MVVDATQKNEEVNTGVKTEMVQIEKIQLDNILQRLAAVEGLNGPALPKGPRVYTARVRFLETAEGKQRMVTGYGKTWEKVDLGGRRYLMLQVFSVDENGVEEKSEVEYVKFMEEGKFLTAEIIGKDTVPQVKELGSIAKTKLDYENYKTEATDKQVPMQVVSEKIIYKLRLPDGKEVELKEEALN